MLRNLERFSLDNNIEKYISSIISLLGGIFFIFLIHKTKYYFVLSHKKNREKKELDILIHNLGVKFKNKQQFKEYFSFLKKNKLEDNNLINMIKSKTIPKILKEISFLKFNFTKNFIHKLEIISEFKNYQPNEFLEDVKT